MSRLLIVDDSVDLLEAMKFFLERKGYTVMTISNNQNIYQVVNEFNPDLILLDVFIHGKDSRVLCKELRRHIETKYLCIMLFSSSPTALENHSEHGADGIIVKPFGLVNLVERIEAILDGCKDNVVQ